MDFGSIISRAIKITWNYKVLWILGFLTALGAGGGSGGGANFPSGQSLGNGSSRGGSGVPTWMQNIMRNPEPLLVGAAALICILFIIALVFAIIGIIARGGLIAGVQQIEMEGTTSLGGAWKAGARRFWPMLGLHLLLGIPVVILIVVIVVVFAATFGGTIVAAISAGGGDFSNSDRSALMGMLAGGFSVICCMMCVALVYGLVTSAVTTLGERAIILENAGVFASVGRAWRLLRANLGNMIVLALLMGAIAFVFGIVSSTIGIALILPTMLPMVFSFSNGTVPAIGVIVLSVGAIFVAIIVGAIVNAVFITFNSTAWTLAYRQFSGIVPAIVATTPSTPSLPVA